MKFIEFITKKSIYVDVEADSQKNVFKILGNLFAKKNSTLSSKIIDNLNERERLVVQALETELQSRTLRLRI
jgi:mannitol/fructose-specific phosphotransferase system IIA component (Ntr-type)